MPKERVSVIPNAVDADVFEPDYSRSIPPEDKGSNFKQLKFSDRNGEIDLEICERGQYQCNKIK